MDVGWLKNMQVFVPPKALWVNRCHVLEENIHNQYIWIKGLYLEYMKNYNLIIRQIMQWKMDKRFKGIIHTFLPNKCKWPTDILKKSSYHSSRKIKFKPQSNPMTYLLEWLKRCGRSQILEKLEFSLIAGVSVRWNNLLRKLAVSPKVEHTYTLWPSSSTPCYLSKRNKGIYIHKKPK